MEQIGTYHLADNPQLYEIQRENNYEFIVTGIDNIVRAGATPDDADAILSNAQEVLRLSVSKAAVPHFTQDVVQLKRGNSTLKYAGVPTFNAGSFEFNDFVGAHTKDVLMAWQNLSYNVDTEKVGSLDVTKYKKDCYLHEYTPDYRLVRTWRLYGCWISELSEGEYNNDNGGKHMIQAKIEYDRAKVDSVATL